MWYDINYLGLLYNNIKPVLDYILEIISDALERDVDFSAFVDSDVLYICDKSTWLTYSVSFSLLSVVLC